MGFALVYIGSHYVVDLLMGVLLAAGVWRIAGPWASFMLPPKHRGGTPTAP
jgi:membrane-associated phospholipid phosphatase